MRLHLNTFSDYKFPYTERALLEFSIARMSPILLELTWLSIFCKGIVWIWTIIWNFEYRKVELYENVEKMVFDHQKFIFGQIHQCCSWKIPHRGPMWALPMGGWGSLWADTCHQTIFSHQMLIYGHYLWYLVQYSKNWVFRKVKINVFAFLGGFCLSGFWV